MNLNSRESLIARLRRGRSVRERFVASHLDKGIGHQLRATRERLKWSQERLAEKAGMNQNAISRLESRDYGKPTITTLKRLAAALDVGLIVRFVPFSEMVDWASGTPRLVEGLVTSALAVPDFAAEEASGSFGDSTPAVLRGGAAKSAQTDEPVPDSNPMGCNALNAALPLPWAQQDNVVMEAARAANR